jgi:hypothetical protein
VRRLQAAELDGAQVYAQCTAQRNDEALRQRLGVSAAAVAQATQRYEVNGAALSLYQFAIPAMPLGGATVDELVDLYDTAMVPATSRGRWAYDRIKASAPRGICPYCGQLPVKTLDHYLPKRPSGLLAMVLKNLVPCCKACNHAKGSAVPQGAAMQPFHPYFDDTEDATWLCARLVNANGSWCSSLSVPSPPGPRSNKRVRTVILPCSVLPICMQVRRPMNSPVSNGGSTKLVYREAPQRCERICP